MSANLNRICKFFGSLLLNAGCFASGLLFLHRLERFGVYRSVKKHFLALRYVTYSLAVMLNITLGTSVVGPGNAGPPTHTSLTCDRHRRCMLLRPLSAPFQLR